MGNEHLFEIEVAYAAEDRIFRETLQVSSGTTVKEALQASRLAVEFPALDIFNARVGIYGDSVDWGHVVEPFDRIEIYRPLTMSPKEARRLRALRKVD